MAAIESGLTHAGDRLGVAARLLRVLIVFAMANLVVNVAYFEIVMYRDIEVFPDNEGGLAAMSWWDYSLFVVPAALVIAPHVALALAAGRRLQPLRDGDEWTRKNLHFLSYVCALGLAILAYWTYTVMGSANYDDGIAAYSLSAAVESTGSLNALGWMGAASFFATMALAVGALAMAVLTRPLRGGRQ
jgi:hypothetical protein